MKNRLFSVGTAGAALLLAGCANHLEDITKETPENTRNVLGSQYILTPEKEIPDSSSFKITLEQVENIKVTVYQVRKNSALYTPYEGWRESYEFLTGLCLFPVAVEIHHDLPVELFGVVYQKPNQPVRQKEAAVELYVVQALHFIQERFAYALCVSVYHALFLFLFFPAARTPGAPPDG